MVHLRILIAGLLLGASVPRTNRKTIKATYQMACSAYVVLAATRKGHFIVGVKAKSGVLRAVGLSGVLLHPGESFDFRQMNGRDKAFFPREVFDFGFMRDDVD